MKRVILFGSQARGDAEKTSDVDVLIVLQGKVRASDEIARTGKIAARLSLKYDCVISCLFISAERFGDEQISLMLNVRREGVAV